MNKKKSLFGFTGLVIFAIIVRSALYFIGDYSDRKTNPHILLLIFGLIVTVFVLFLIWGLIHYQNKHNKHSDK